MKFGPLPVTQTRGAILAHSVMLEGLSLKKGRVLSAEDVAAMQRAGLETVWAALLEPSDIGENKAALRIAQAIAGPGIEISEAFTGRVNLMAPAQGLLEIDSQRLQALNQIDEGATVATLPAFERCGAGQMLATVKIIPFALPEPVVAVAEQLALEGRDAVLKFHPFMPHSAGLVLTSVSGSKRGILAKREGAIRDRLQDCGSRLQEVLRVAHTIEAVAAAIDELAAKGCDPILVFGASAIVDRGDVIPAGLVQAGGEVIHLGMPVDPGNLLMLGEIAGRPVIGVPSCASSPKINGFDWVLQRLLAGLTLGRNEIVAMAAGGLLKEISSRPQPRNLKPKTSGRHAPRIAALILAAGRSTRMGANKLLADLGGQAVLAHTVEAALASHARPVMVVTGHEAGEVERLLNGYDLQLIHNPRYREGLSTSLAAGLAALPEDVDGVLVCLGDMPIISAPHLDRLIAAFAPEEGRAICLPVAAGKRGNPVLWGAEFFAEMRAVEGDTGARHLIGTHLERVCEVEMDDAAVLVDVDTPEALHAVREAHAAGTIAGRQSKDQKK